MIEPRDPRGDAAIALADVELEGGTTRGGGLDSSKGEMALLPVSSLNDRGLGNGRLIAPRESAPVGVVSREDRPL